MLLETIDLATSTVDYIIVDFWNRSGRGSFYETNTKPTRLSL